MIRHLPAFVSPNKAFLFCVCELPLYYKQISKSLLILLFNLHDYCISTIPKPSRQAGPLKPYFRYLHSFYQQKYKFSFITTAFHLRHLTFILYHPKTSYPFITTSHKS